MKPLYILLTALVFSWMTSSVLAQSPSLSRSVQRFKKQDSIAPPAKNIILFAGSSSFTNWTDVKEHFPNKPILNRGFGGSKLSDMIYYIDDIIFPYRPKQIVIYCGENDFGASDTITVQTVYERFTKLYHLIRQRYKKVTITYVSMKPSPSRVALMPKMESANEQIKAFMSGRKRSSYVDIYHAMLDAEGKVREDLFIADRLHMNKQGYKIWQGLIGPHLK